MDNFNEQELISRTKFDFHTLNIPFIEELEIEPVAVDIGYDGVKVFSMWGKHTFPSLPIKMGKEKRLDNSGIGNNATYIMYKDSDDTVWFVGDLARDMVDSGRKTYNYDVLYGRSRTSTPEYKVLLRTSVALTLVKDLSDLNKPDYRIKANNLKVITGLPEDWLNDTDKLVNAFKGTHKFSIKIGNSNWIPVSFELNENDEKDIFVISQPKGTIFSVATNVYGDIINPGLLLSNNVIVFDGGFGTNDIYYAKKGQKANSTSFTDNAMIEVYKSTCDDIHDGTRNIREVRVYELDKYISNDYKVPYVENGTKQVFNFKQAMDNNIEDFAMDAIDRMNTIYSYFQDVDYVVCTGGTGEAYYSHFEREIPTNVLLAKKENGVNLAENFTPVFSNVVGFFCYLIAHFKMVYKNKTKNVESKIEKKVDEVITTIE